MQQYLELAAPCAGSGRTSFRPNRDRHEICVWWQMRFDLLAGFPLLTTKKLHIRSIIHELLWFIKGDTNIAYLKDNGVSIWDEWADEEWRSRPCLWSAMAVMAKTRRTGH